MEFFVKLETSSAKAPARQSAEAAGYDLYSDEDQMISPGDRRLVSIGCSMKIPQGHYGRVAPRSGLSVKKSIDIGAGVIDSDYRGLVKVLLINNGRETFFISKGDRIAQLILEKISTPDLEVVENLDETDRGSGGFGSTGN